jgi:hypothetical protein
MKRHVPDGSRRRRLGAMLGATAVVAMLAFWAIAAMRQSSATSTSTNHISTTQAPGSAGMVVALDPETGTFGPPNAEQAKALEEQMKASLNQSDVGLEFVNHPDGSTSVDLQGRFQSMSIAQIGPDGRVHTTCVDTHEAAHAVLDGTAPVGPEVK